MKSAGSWLMFGDPFHIRYLDNFSNSLIIFKRSSWLTFPMAYIAFLYFCEILLWYWKPERLPTPFLIFPILLLTLKMCFSFFQTVKLCWDNHGDDLVTTLDLLVFPNFATTTIVHVHRLKQIFLPCEFFLPECLLSGSTMINRRWCYNN